MPKKKKSSRPYSKPVKGAPGLRQHSKKPFAPRQASKKKRSY